MAKTLPTSLRVKVDTLFRITVPKPCFWLPMLIYGAGTSDGLNIYDYKSDSIIKIRTDTKPLKLVYNDITVLAASIDKSKIWLGTYGNGVNYFDWGKKGVLRDGFPQTA